MKRFISLGGVALAAVICGGLLLMPGCATRTKHEWLTLFFDGVPPLEGDVSEAPVDIEGEPVNGAASETSRTRPVKVRPRKYLHEPFGERQCTDCHESAYSQRLAGAVADVCFSCHDNVVAEFRFQHDPVAEGECLECHEPHESLQPKLVKLPVPDLCYECHDDVAEAEFKHDPAAGGECLECHNPHASGEPALLKQAVPEVCYECHDDVAEAEFKHDPAAGGECLECHSPHASGEPALLKRAAQQVCYECHDQDDVTSTEAHLAIGAEPCTACHNPHAGDQQYFLKPDRISRPVQTPTQTNE